MRLENVWRGEGFSRWVGRLLFAAGVLFVLSFLARQMVFFPARYPEGLWDLQSRFVAEDVFLTGPDGVNIHGWLIPAVTPDPGVTTLYLHGNAGNLTHRVDHITQITRAGSELLIVDYRGYGKSEGAPSEEGLYLDAAAAYDWLAAQGRRTIILHGESLGTVPAVELATRREAAALILEAPFPSAKAVAQQVLPLLGPLIVSGFETAARIPHVGCPVFVMHGDRDEVIAYKLGKEVFEAGFQPKEMWTVEGAGHNDIVAASGEAYGSMLRRIYADASRGAAR